MFKTKWNANNNNNNPASRFKVLVYGEGASGASCLFFLPCSFRTPQIVIKNQRRRRRKA